MTDDEGTPLAPVMLTGIAAGVFHDLKDAASKMVDETHVYLPRSGYHDKYMEAYERYEKLYSAVRGLVV